MSRLAAIIALVVLSCGQPMAGAREPLEIIRTAWTASNVIESASGQGTLRDHDSVKGLITSLDFEVIIADAKYQLKVNHHPIDGRKPRYDRHVVVCDGSSVFSTSYSPRIGLGGCETMIFENRLGALFIATATFHWDPARLPQTLPYDIDKLNEKYGVTFTTLANGDIQGNYALSERVRVRFTCPAAAGFNVVSQELLDGDGTNPREVYRATWQQSGTEWYIQKLVGFRKDRRIELEYSSFTANAPIPENAFSWSGLNPCPGSRVVDQRPNAQRP